MNSINSDMGLILDMMPDDSIIHEEIESGKPNEYYQGQAEQILQTIDTKEHYFHFVITILKNYHTLNNEQKRKIVELLDIKPKIIEKKIIKEKIVYKQSKKPQLNNYDDY